MSLERLDRWEALERLGELKKRLDELARRYAGEEGFGQWMPDVDILEEDDHYLILLDVPGVKPEDLELYEEGRTLTLAGIRHPREGQYLKRERPEGYFQRVIVLPEPVAEGSAEASLKNGVLEIRIAKRPGQRVQVRPE